jgi:hypothetical protein
MQDFFVAIDAAEGWAVTYALLIWIAVIGAAVAVLRWKFGTRRARKVAAGRVTHRWGKV